MRKRKQKIQPLLFENYLAVIKNSLGSKLFRNFYAKVNGKTIDIMKNGELSCAFYVSSVLALFKLIRDVHGTVDSTVKNLKKSGWKKIKKPKVGSVIVWEKIDFGNNDIHKHIGFFVGKSRAISINYKLGYPTQHYWTFGLKQSKPKRKIETIFWNPKLN